MQRFVRFSRTLHPFCTVARGLSSAREVHSPFPSMQPYPVVSLPELMIANMQRFGDSPAFVDGFTKQSVTYSEVIRNLRSTAAGLQKLGIGSGDVVAIVSPNHVHFAAAFYGIGMLGAASTTINPLYTEREMLHQLEVTGAKAIITHQFNLEHAKAVAAQRKIPVICFGGKQEDGVIPFESFFAESGDHIVPPKVDKTTLCTIPFSSGTTGKPKGTMLTHYNLVSNMLQFMPAEGVNIPAGSAILMPLPFFHIYGMAVGMNVALSRGATVISMPKFDLEKFLSLIQEYKAERAYVAPPIILALAKHPLVDKFDLSSLKALMSGAAPLGTEIEQACAKRLNVTVKQGWGMTETSPLAACTSDEGVKPGSGTVGFLTPDTIARISHPETGELLDPLTDGEIQIKGPQVMLGYLHNEEATRNMMTSDGFLRTGDIGGFDKDGYLYIRDRAKELIKYKGFQVPPAELEDVIGGHPAVKDCTVIPVPDVEAGELPRAYVVLKDGVSATEAEIDEYVANLVAPYKRLRGGIIFTDEIPKSASGKILRRIVREQDEKMRAQQKK